MVILFKFLILMQFSENVERIGYTIEQPSILEDACLYSGWNAIFKLCKY